MLETILSLFLFANAPPPNSNYAKVVESLSQIAQQNPATSELFNLGLSDSGENIVGIKIGNGATADLVVATHHGNEFGSTAVGLGAAEEFARNPIPGHTVYIIPVLNIQGYNNLNRYEKVSGRNVDLNRDYPGPCVDKKSFQSRATKALANFLDQKNIISSATLHTYWPAVLYPWGMSAKQSGTKDESLFINLSKAAAVESRYEVGNSKDLLYAADGAFEDYAYWQHGIWSLLFEMGGSHNPSQASMKTMVQVNTPGLRRFFEMAPKQRSTEHAFTGTCMSQKSRSERPHLE